MKKLLDWLLGRSPGTAQESVKDAGAEARRERDLQRLAKLTKTSNLPGLDQGWKKEGKG